MLIGILSDSHGRHLAVRRAVALLERAGVEHVIHCGDVGGAEVFDELLTRPLTFVWGNMDFPEPQLILHLESLGIKPPNDVPTRVNLGGKSFAVFHGHEPEFAADLSSLEVDFVLHGHTHVARDEPVAGRRVINPGALYRARRKTAAILDTDTDELAFHEIRAD